RVREIPVGGDQVPLVDAEQPAEPVLRNAGIAEPLLVADLHDIDIAASADAEALRLEAFDLEPLRAEALAEALEIEALAVEAQALSGTEPAGTGVEPDRCQDDQSDPGRRPRGQHRDADRCCDHRESKAQVRALAVRPEKDGIRRGRVAHAGTRLRANSRAA